MFSTETFDLLTIFNEKNQLSKNEISAFSESALDYLLEHHLIASNFVTVDENTPETFSITEIGKAQFLHYLYQKETYESVKKLAQAAQSEAATSKYAAISASKSAENAHQIAKDLKEQVSKIENISQAVKIQADIATDYSKKRDIKGILTVIIAFISLLISILEKIDIHIYWIK